LVVLTVDCVAVWWWRW